MDELLSLNQFVCATDGSAYKDLMSSGSIAWINGNIYGLNNLSFVSPPSHSNQKSTVFAVMKA
jgi:hypothetical protein